MPCSRSWRSARSTTAGTSRSTRPRWYGEAADRLRDEDPALLYALALARYRAGSPAAAIDPLRRAIDRNDSVAQTYYLLGLVYRDTNKIDDAIVALRHAIKIAPSLTPAREELADLYRDRRTGSLRR